MAVITEISVHDVRFPTSDFQDGSDAIHADPDYSCVYVILTTSIAGLEGHGFTFSLGRGNEIIAACVKTLAKLVVGQSLESIVADWVGFNRKLQNETQLRWIGPEKGPLHMACGAIVNACWDLWCKKEGKPLWKLVAELTPEEVVGLVDWHYLKDALTPDEALAALRAAREGRDARMAEMLHRGYPAYTTSAGWLGYSDEKIRGLCKEYLGLGYDAFKMKVGASIDDDLRRAAVIREEIGDERRLMMDANQRWGVAETVENMTRLAAYKPLWIEEPTHADDILGHAAIAKALAPLDVGVATGEVACNVIMFKQLLQAGAIKFCQVDACRLAGVNEVLAVLLLSHKFGVAVCPHAGGVGLCEYVRHISMIDYVVVSATTEGRVCESTTHLHEHFYDTENFLKQGCYVAPKAPGYATMRPESLAEFAYPDGPVWVKRGHGDRLRVASC